MNSPDLNQITFEKHYSSFSTDKNNRIHATGVIARHVTDLCGASEM